MEEPVQIPSLHAVPEVLSVELCFARSIALELEIAVAYFDVTSVVAAFAEHVASVVVVAVPSHLDLRHFPGRSCS